MMCEGTICHYGYAGAFLWPPRCVAVYSSSIYRLFSFIAVMVICETAESRFEAIREQIKELKEKVPADQYYWWEILKLYDSFMAIFGAY